jgi:hypothetical protein
LISAFDDIEGDVADEITRRVSTSLDEFLAIDDDKNRLARSWEDIDKRLWDKVTADCPTMYSTSSETKITRNEDGSVHKETVTTDKLPDGTTRTTRIVDTTPPSGDPYQSRSERTVTTSPVTDTTQQDLSWPESEKPKAVQRFIESTNKDDTRSNSTPSNPTWWFWSRK